MLDPILKWVGGKRWMKDTLTDLWLANPSERFVEPFCGALGASLSVNPKRALLNDFNPHLIQLFKGIKRGEEFDILMESNEELFYQYREAFNHLDYTVGANWETAQLFFYLIQTGFNGLCRYNLSGEFNVPFGKYKSVNYERDLAAYRKQFRGWTFSNRDFAQVNTRPGDFVFIDSPYYETFSSYTPQGFSWDDQLRLVEFASSIECPVVCTNNAVPSLMEEYIRNGFEVRVMLAPRSVSSDGNREAAFEMVATKNVELTDYYLSHSREVKLKVSWSRRK